MQRLKVSEVPRSRSGNGLPVKAGEKKGCFFPKKGVPSFRPHLVLKTGKSALKARLHTFGLALSKAESHGYTHIKTG